MEVVNYIIINGIFRRRNQSVSQSGFVLKLSERVFKALNNLGFIPLLHLPKWNGAGKAASVSVGNIKVMFEPIIAVMFIVKDGNARCALVHPPPKLLVPFFDFKDSRCVRALGVNQNLLVKAAFIVAASGAHKRHPFCRVIRHSSEDGFIHSADKLILCRHQAYLLSSFITG
ncbi:MAG: hypothetical protein PHV32_14645 [Eubacteriales bacterium]|nr:hypothetical protein [Eubacteriales bacterium]